ncbi:MAG: cupin domain-containing protein [Anaerolineales bacterium]
MRPPITQIDFNHLAWSDHPTLAGVQTKLVPHAGFPPDDVLLARVAPDGEIPWHVHPQQSEFAYVLSGNGEIYGKAAESDPAGDALPLATGRAVVVPPDCWHSVRNTGADDLILLALHLPTG